VPFHRSEIRPTLSYYDPLPLHAAILVCFEHSFWNDQQGSDPVEGFIKAWKSYLKTQRALVDREVDDYLRSKGSNDRFIMKRRPSDEERAECKKIVLKNLLCESSTCHL